MDVHALISRSLPIVAIVLLIGVVQRLLSNKANAIHRVETAIATLTPPAWNFVAMEYCYGMLNRIYLVFVTQDTLVGLRVRGPISAPMLVTQQHYNPYFYPRPRKIEKYTHANLESSSLLKIWSANFQIPKRNIARLEFTAEPKWGMGLLPYSCRIILHLQNGSKRELILLGTQDGQNVLSKLSANL
jgi:hypothetical protein